MPATQMNFHNKKQKTPVLPTRDTHTKNLCKTKKQKTNKQC